MVGSDRDAGAIEAARSNAERAGVAHHIEFFVAPLSTATPPATGGLLITNPPYGVRTGDSATLRNLYARLGTVARDAFAGWSFAMLSADRTRGHVLERQLGMRLTPAWQSTNGGIPVRLLRTRSRTRDSRGRS
jgi:putative N6-adenine-specific DNA methylase